MKTQTITLIGRKWFHHGPGNTYHSVTALVNGEQKARVDFHYGYGNQWEYTGMSALKQAGFIPDYDSGKDSPWGYCDRRGIKYHAEATDVQRKKDL